MGKMNVIIVQVNEKDMVVLSEAGDFLCVPRPMEAVRAGETIYVEATARERERRGAWLKTVMEKMSVQRRFWAAAAFVIIAIGCSFLVNEVTPQPAVASMIIDVGPKIELLTDDQGRVIEAKSDSGDGESLLKGLTLDKLPANEALTILVQKAVADGLVNDNAEKQPGLVTWSPLPGHSEYVLPISQEMLQHQLEDTLNYTKKTYVQRPNQQEEALSNKESAKGDGVKDNPHLKLQKENESIIDKDIDKEEKDSKEKESLKSDDNGSKGNKEREEEKIDKGMNKEKGQKIH
ncbi:hypothetical protein H1S01_19570 [Heliobacterium chlorum]|uniref:RsgI N-terminal anti-sigma domain-containing protein n=1 Tax=Heliobacterium chlorum TaxID=2698 RepID=A0ABR7T8B0_HELCL|nr:hypothetical protein [Heliobacterium chlorum]MBC9786645.1 hypothetical protein [Heliobacterium chlorum]